MDCMLLKIAGTENQHKTTILSAFACVCVFCVREGSFCNKNAGWVATYSLLSISNQLGISNMRNLTLSHGSSEFFAVFEKAKRPIVTLGFQGRVT